MSEPKTITGSARKAYRVFCDDFWALFKNRSDEELRWLAIAARNANRTNCGWEFYEMRELVQEMSENMLKLRKDNPDAAS